MAHTWRFFRAGGFDQVRIDTGADIAHLRELDPKLWVALSCPAQGLELDPRTLALLDEDHDGRIRVPEVVAAATWACSLLKNPDDLLRGGAELPLEAIDARTEEGRRLLASARQVLTNLGKADSPTLAPADVADTAKTFARTLFNGDGVLPPEAAEKDADMARALQDILSCVGSVKDVSGMDGVDQPGLDQFFREAETYLAWTRRASADFNASAFDAFREVKPKVEDYFTRCALAAMDSRAVAALRPGEALYASLAATDLSADSPALRALPLARIEPSMPLPLREGLNPAWAASVAGLRDEVIAPLLGPRAELTHSEWSRLNEALAAQQVWYAEKPVVSVEKLGQKRLEEITQPRVKAAIAALMAKDRALEPELKAIVSVERLSHYFRDLARFLNNFVAFKDFYTHQAGALFQAGKLFLDGRSCDLCLRVDDGTRHSALAGLSMAYLAYCDLTRKGSAEKMQIVAAFTDGDSDLLMVGRNGIFFDRQGRDWDATIVKLVEQPISVRQAFWAPYKKVARFVENQVNHFAGTQEGEGQVLPKEKGGFDIAKFAGVFAAIGLAAGMAGSALAAILTGFLGLKAWQMPVVLAGGALVISGPSMLLAAMKLRKRNLGPLLDACGWAINSRAKINIPFGESLTQLATLPPGSERAFADPYGESRRPWRLFLALALLAGGLVWLWRDGHLAAWLKALHR